MDEYTCELCGAPTNRKIFRIIEGVKMLVCHNCQDLGEVPKAPKSRNIYRSKYESGGTINPPQRRYYLDEDTHTANPSITYRRKQNKIQTRPQFNRSRKPNIEDLELKENYRDILKKTRVKLKLTQSQFANNLKIAVTSYKNIENGRLDLTIKEALRIENQYNIKLTKELDDESFDDFKSKNASNGDMTLGDVFFRRKRGKNPDMDE